MACTFCKITLTEFQACISHRERLVNFLQLHGVLPGDVKCPHCRKTCKFYPTDDFRCTQASCEYSVSIRKDTLFENVRLPLNEICWFVALWLISFPPNELVLQNELNLSAQTVTDWSNFCREVCFVCMVHESKPIGGPNKVVEVKELKRECNRGTVIEGQWVFGGIERGRDSFLVAVPDRCAGTLLQVIRNWVLPGTTIVSECWKSYDCLSDEGFQQEAVNSSKNFVDPSPSADAPNVKRLWRAVSSKVLPSGPQESRLDGYMAEFQFRLKYSDHRDTFHYFFKYMSHVNPPVESDAGPASEGSS